MKKLFFVSLLMGASYLTAQNNARVLTADELQQEKQKIALMQISGMVGEVLFEEKQSFYVKGQNFSSFTVIPIRYNYQSAEMSGARYRCSVVISFRDLAPYRIDTIGYGWAEIPECNGVKAIIVMDMEKEHMPRILLNYSTSIRDEDLTAPMVLDWDAASGRYVADEKLSEHLEDAHGTDTIAGMKRALRAYDEAHKRRK